MISQEAVQSDAGSDNHTRLSGRRLLFARATWLSAVALVLGLYALSILLQAQALRTACTDNCQYGQITAAKMQELQQLGLSLDFYIAYNIALNTVFFLVFVAVGALIFWRKSSDWFGIYVALALVLFGISFSNPLSLLAKQYATLSLPLDVMAALGGTLIGVFTYLFPDGRFVPRWTRWLIPFLVAREFANVFSPDFSNSLLGNAAFFIELGSYLFAQIYRYRRVSDNVQRQQTKWFVYGTSVGILGFVSLILLVSLSSPTGQPTSVVVDLIGGTALYMFMLLIPLSLMMAILRYRLWDIDLLINRTLVYFPLTAILAGIFAASITLSQKVFIAITGATSDAATVLTTLIVVAVFDPLKLSLQHFVDRRFKEAPDASKSLKAFAQQLQSGYGVVDPRRLARRFLNEAVAAFDATGGAIYLGHDGTAQLVHARGEWHDDAALRVRLHAEGRQTQLGYVTLGTRRNGNEYSDGDRATLNEMAKIVADAIQATQE